MRLDVDSVETEPDATVMPSARRRRALADRRAVEKRHEDRLGVSIANRVVRHVTSSLSLGACPGDTLAANGVALTDGRKVNLQQGQRDVQKISHA